MSAKSIGTKVRLLLRVFFVGWLFFRILLLLLRCFCAGTVVCRSVSLLHVDDAISFRPSAFVVLLHTRSLFGSWTQDIGSTLGSD